MAENKTKIEDLDESASGELTENEAAQVAGGQAQRKPEEPCFIDTIYSDGLKTLDVK